MVSYLVHCDTLLQNATDIIIKCDSYYITQCDKSLLQNPSAFLLQNATVLTKRDNFITKCDSYYKIRRLLQNVSVHPTHPSFSGIYKLKFREYIAIAAVRRWKFRNLPIHTTVLIAILNPSVRFAST